MIMAVKRGVIFHLAMKGFFSNYWEAQDIIFHTTTVFLRYIYSSPFCDAKVLIISFTDY